MNESNKISKNKKHLYNVPIKGHNEKEEVPWFRVEMSTWATAEVRSWPREVKKDFSTILTKLQKHETVGYPDTKYMGIIGPGVFEIRLLGRDGIYRAFYVLKSEIGVLVFHAFKKKSQKTPKQEIETGKQRLKYFLETFNK